MLAQPAVSQARQRTPLADTAYNSGLISAESLGRGGTFAASPGSMAAASENPAAIAGSANENNATYVTALVDNVHRSTSSEAGLFTDPEEEKVLRYLSMGSGQGMIFFQPLGRLQINQPLVMPDGTTVGTQDVDFYANSFGFAAAEKWGRGGIGISLSYLWTGLGTADHVTGLSDKSSLDSGDGANASLGLRFPTGPTMWGLVVQNGIVWWKSHQHDSLPVKIRVGNTWKMSPGFLLTVEDEKRFYQSGQQENVISVGNESYLSQQIILRVGVFSSHMDQAEQRHWTGGVTVLAENGVHVSFGFELFDLPPGREMRSLVSVVAPFASAGAEESSSK